jgi:hypothetical protein
MTRSLPARIGLVCGLLALVGASGPAVAEEGVAIKNLLGNMGLVPRERDPIRYRERAPLVIPPKADLPPPAGAETYASANPQWPKDPDVVAKRRRADEERRPVTWSETRRMSDKEARLSPEELRAPGRKAKEAPREAGWFVGDESRASYMLTPDQLRATARGPNEPDPDAVEPARKVLTDPPSGMRKSAMGGAVKRDFQPRIDQQANDANPLNWIRKQFSSDEDE